MRAELGIQVQPHLRTTDTWKSASINLVAEQSFRAKQNSTVFTVIMRTCTKKKVLLECADGLQMTWLELNRLLTMHFSLSYNLENCHCN